MKLNNALPLQTDPVTRQTRMEDQLHRASEMYEQHFLNEMVKAMRSTVHKGEGFIQPNMAENIFSEQLDQQYVEKWADKGGIGLADMIYQQVHDRMFPKHNVARPAGPVPMQHAPIPFGVKTEQKHDGSGRFLFRGEPGKTQSPSEATPVTSPWKGRIESASTDGEGWSHVTLRHENQLRSQLAFRGQLAALEIGADVEGGDSLGMLSPTEPILRWDVGDFS